MLNWRHTGTRRAVVMSLAAALVSCASGNSGDTPLATTRLAVSSSVEGCNLTCSPGDACYFPGALSAGSGGAVKWCSGTIYGTDVTRTTNSTTYENGVFTVNSNANGISLADPVQQIDGVRFVYTQWQGLPGCTGNQCTDVELVVHVESTDSTYTQPGEFGVMIRDATSATDPSVIDSGGANTGALAYLANQSTCGNGTPSEFWYSARTSASLRPAGEPKLTRFAPPDLWMRLQRVGNNFAVAHSRDYGNTWIPWEGGEFSVPTSGSTAPLIGFFGADRGGITGAAITTKFDVVYLGPPRLTARTSWLASSAASASSGFVTRGGRSFYVAPDGTSYKTAVTTEFGLITNRFSSSGGSFRNYGGEWPSVERGGLTGDGSYLYFARKNSITSPTSFWVEKADPNNGLAVINQYPPSSGSCTSSSYPFGKIGGIATQGGTVFVSDVDHNTVHVLSWPSSGCVTESSAPISVSRPGPLAVDFNGNLWVVQTSTPFPQNMFWSEFVTKKCGSPAAPCDTPAVLCYELSGTSWVSCGSSTTITAGLDNPVAIAASPASAKLLIADNGPNQNVVECTNLPPASGSIDCSTTIGQTQGVFGGSTPGLVTSGTTARFYGLFGVGYDSDENVYVADQSPSTAIHKLSAAGVPASGYSTPFGTGEERGSFDPTAPDNFYTLTRHFTFDASKTTPGSEWALHSMTYNPFDSRVADVRTDDGTTVSYVDTSPSTGLPNDLRVRDGWTLTAQPPTLRHMPLGTATGAAGTASDPLFMFVPYYIGVPFWYNTMFNVSLSRLAIFRFEGEIAVPCGAIEFEPSTSTDPKPQLQIWIDSNGNGIRDSGEETNTRSSSPQPSGNFAGFDVDARGDVWLGFLDGLWKLSLTGVNSSGVPQYGLDTASARTIGYQLPSVFTASGAQLSMFRYEAAPSSANDVLYLFGSGATAPADPGCGVIPGADVLLGGYTGITPGVAPTQKFLRSLPKPQTDATDDYYEHLSDVACKQCNCTGSSCSCASDPHCSTNPSDPNCVCTIDYYWFYNSFHVAGDYLFLSEHPGPTHVMNKADGSDVTRLFEGPEESGMTRFWSDQPELVQAVERPSGEYVVTRTDSSFAARTSAMRWTPSTAYSPMSLAPIAWYIASTDNIDQSGGHVSRWADRSGNHHDVLAPNPWNEPAFNSSGWNGTKPTLTFNGADLFIDPNSWTELPGGQDKSFSVLAVLRTTSTAGQGIANWWTSNWPQILFTRLEPSGSAVVPDLLRIDEWNVQQHAVGSSAQALGTDRHFVAWRFNYATSSMQLDVDGTSTTTSSLPDLDNVGIDTFIIGAASPLPTELFTGDISEIAIFGHALSDTEVAAFRAYAQTAWTGLP